MSYIIIQSCHTETNKKKQISILINVAHQYAIQERVFIVLTYYQKLCLFYSLWIFFCYCRLRPLYQRTHWFLQDEN